MLIDGQFMNVTPKDFEDFKYDLLLKDKQGIHVIVDLQKFSYIVTRLIITTGVDSAGNKLTDKEIGYAKLILKQIVHNLKSLKIEHGYCDDLD